MNETAFLTLNGLSGGLISIRCDQIVGVSDCTHTIDGEQVPGSFITTVSGNTATVLDSRTDVLDRLAVVSAALHWSE